ncbi:MAG: PmoA family protein, partial [Planctomycetaceae bacterium]|nr:PmoA family protein [Planctomycetaceae bacterium]
MMIRRVFLLLVVGVSVCCVMVFTGVVGIFAAEGFRFAEKNDEKQLVLTDWSLPVLTYRFDAVEHDQVPAKESRRLAGCYVHPLYGIDGEVLTDNAPKDHYHHHGVFWTWPHVGVHEADGKVKR